LRTRERTLLPIVVLLNSGVSTISCIPLSSTCGLRGGQS
jgi:hypothetical protein